MTKIAQFGIILAVIGIVVALIGFFPNAASDAAGLAQKNGIGVMQGVTIASGLAMLGLGALVYFQGNSLASAPQQLILPNQSRINQATKEWRFIDFQELWQYRRVLYFLSWRDVQVRYKQTIFGIMWAIISPLITMIVFTFVFKSIADVPSYDIPYPIFSYSGLVLWGMFSKSIAGASLSVVSDGNLLARVYFPRVIAPISKLAVGVVDFFFAFGMLMVLMVIFQTPPTINVIWLPVFFLLTLATALGIGMWLSTLHVRFRDIGQFIPFIVQIWMYLSPVPYPSDVLDEPWRTLYGINPIASALDGFRWALLGTHSVHLPALLLSCIVATLVLVGGIFVFRRSEKTFPDYI